MAKPQRRSGPQRVDHDGFDFTRHMRALCDDLVARLPPLKHIDMRYVAVSFSQARKSVRHGIQASLTPMRFAGGHLVEQRHGQWYSIQRLYSRNRVEMLYILNFYMPRFLDCPLHEKLVTILHELWHIGPRFDGDIRRHSGRCYAHSGSQKNYDARMCELADQWLALNPPRPLFAFLEYDFDGLQRIYGRVFGLKAAHPKLLRISGEQARQIRASAPSNQPIDT